MRIITALPLGNLDDAGLIEELREVLAADVITKYTLASSDGSTYS